MVSDTLTVQPIGPMRVLGSQNNLVMFVSGRRLGCHTALKVIRASYFGNKFKLIGF